MGYFGNYVTSPIIVWPFKILSGSRTIQGGDGTNPATATVSSYNLPVQNAIWEGTGAGIDSIGDMCALLETAFESIYAAVYTPDTATYTVTVETDGRLKVSTNAADDLYIYGTSLASSLTTWDLGQMGWDDTTYTMVGAAENNQILGTKICQYQWYSGINSNWDSGEYQRNLRYSKMMVNGREARVKHTDSPWYERQVWWDLVPMARCIDDRANSAAFATAAGFATGEPMTLENLVDYVDIESTTNYPYPGGVYVGDKADRSLTIWSSRYEILLERSALLDGVKMEHVDGVSMEMAEVRLFFRR